MFLSQGHIALPEFPFALEPRIITRFDADRLDPHIAPLLSSLCADTPERR